MGSRIESRTRLKIHKIKEAMQSHRTHISHQRYHNLPPAYLRMAYIPQGCTKTDRKRRVPQPAQNNSVDDKKGRERFEVLGKVAEILHHGKACPNQRTIDNTIGHIVEFVTQDHEQQQQPQPLNRLLRHTCIQPLEY